MKVNITKFKHVVRKNIYQANAVFQQNTIKIALLILFAFIVIQKDISIEFGLHSSKSKFQKQIISQPDSVQPAFINQIEPSFDAKPIKSSNATRQFSSLVFLLNPNYAKHHNIDPKIVKAKNQIVYDYLKQYSPIAISEMKKFGIPASITLAQGLLESDAGESKLATRNNNHFGIKCFSKSCKHGHCANFTDDSHKDFFRKYASVWESFRDHSNFLHRSRYKHLIKLGTKDYRGWANGLRKAGYATDKRYAKKLILIIEILKLHEYDV